MGQYGIKDIICWRSSCNVGKNGVEKIEEINLDDKEKSEFINSVECSQKIFGKQPLKLILI